jgi:hypothetical protein
MKYIILRETSGSLLKGCDLVKKFINLVDEFLKLHFLYITRYYIFFLSKVLD